MLLSIVEERAIILKKEKEMPQQLMNHIPHTNEFAKNIVSKKGYEFKRLYQRMKIILEKEPQIVCLSAGMRILPFQPGKDENNLYEVYDETFKDSWGYSKIEAAEWISRKKGKTMTLLFGSSFGNTTNQLDF
jgi:mycothiol synthase